MFYYKLVLFFTTPQLSGCSDLCPWLHNRWSWNYTTLLVKISSNNPVFMLTANNDHFPHSIHHLVSLMQPFLTWGPKGSKERF